MGYEYEGYSQAGFCLPQANIDRFRQAIVEATGGDFWEGMQPPDPDNLEELLRRLDWEYEEDAAGNIVDLSLSFDKHTDGDVVENALCGLVVPGSELVFRGEEGEEWLYRYAGNGYEHISGVTLFPANGERAVILKGVEIAYINIALPPGPATDAIRAKLSPLPTSETETHKKGTNHDTV